MSSPEFKLLQLRLREVELDALECLALRPAKIWVSAFELRNALIGIHLKIG